MTTQEIDCGEGRPIHQPAARGAGLVIGTREMPLPPELAALLREALAAERELMIHTRAWDWAVKTLVAVLEGELALTGTTRAEMRFSADALPPRVVGAWTGATLERIPRVEIRDPETLLEILGAEAFEELVTEEVTFHPTARLLELAHDPDALEAAAIRRCLHLTVRNDLTFQPPQQGE